MSNRLEVAIKWKLDVAFGKLSESGYEGVAHYDKSYLSFSGSISDKELDEICAKAQENGVYIGHHMGEIVALSPRS